MLIPTEGPSAARPALGPSLFLEMPRIHAAAGMNSVKPAPARRQLWRGRPA
jgi:hypothetical protein